MPAERGDNDRDNEASYKGYASSHGKLPIMPGTAVGPTLQVPDGGLLRRSKDISVPFEPLFCRCSSGARRVAVVLGVDDGD